MSTFARLEIGRNGVWNLIGRFKASDPEQAQEVLAKAEDLAKALIWDQTPSNLTMRVATSDSIRATVCTWSLADGWRDPRTGDPV